MMCCFTWRFPRLSALVMFLRASLSTDIRTMVTARGTSMVSGMLCRTTLADNPCPQAMGPSGMWEPLAAPRRMLLWVRNMQDTSSTAERRIVNKRRSAPRPRSCTLQHNRIGHFASSITPQRSHPFSRDLRRLFLYYCISSLLHHDPRKPPQAQICSNPSIDASLITFVGWSRVGCACIYLFNGI